MDWFGQLPTDWNVSPIRFVSQIVQGSTPDSSDSRYWSDDSNSITWVTPADMSDIGWINDSARQLSPLGYSSCGTQLVPKGSVIISSRAPIGKVNRATKGLCTNQGCKSLVPKFINPDYLYWACVCAKSEMVLLGRGTTFMELSAYDLGHMQIPFPPVVEQGAIASVLDENCASIEAIVSVLQKQCEMLERYRASVIHEAVTKGLDPSVSTRPSGVEWIGDIPEHWNIARLKDVIVICNGREVVSDTGAIPVYGSGGVFKWTDKFLYDGESILFGRKGTIDKPLYVHGPFWTVDTMFYSYLQACGFLKYVYYCAQCFDFHKYESGSTLPSMTQTDLGSIRIPFPPVNVQEEISDLLDRRCADIDMVLKTKREQLDVLKRRRQSLIYEYVTGKRRVNGQE